MNEKIVQSPLFARIISYILLLIPIMMFYSVLKDFLSGNVDGTFWVYLSVSAGLFLFFFTLLIANHQVHNYTETHITTKYPFLKMKVYSLADLKGWVVTPGQNVNMIHFFFSKSKLSIGIGSERSLRIFEQIIEKNFDRIEKEQMAAIERDNLFVKSSRNSGVIIGANGLKVMKGKILKEYNWPNVSSLRIDDAQVLLPVEIYFVDGTKVKFDAYDCLGGIGLYNFLKGKQSDLNPDSI